jgi:versiconal hemiacetal acetate esterase
MRVFSVANMYDEYDGYPHYFWTFPSKNLDKIREEYGKNLLKGVEFVMS